MPDDVLDNTQNPDEALLQEIRDFYTYASDYWREAREQRKVNMRYLCGDPWDPEDRKERKDAGRPCISHDELNQYVNQCVNSARQNKRGIKIEPRGKGATNKTAELRQDIARTIEYHSNAQSIYLRSYQDEVEGGYGFCRVSRRWISNDSFNQEIVIRPISNPDSVLYDPQCKEPDWSDARKVLVLDPISREQFRNQYPNAEIKDFSSEHMRLAPGWIQEKTVLVAEYWKVESEFSKLYLLESGETVKELPEGAKPKRERTVESKRVIQYVTNGVEILERTEQPGEEIPIPAFIGLERYIDDGNGPKQKISGLVEFALNPQMSLAYLVSLEAEEAGQSPKSPYLGYKGQFESDSEAWETANKVPHAYLQVDPAVDAATGHVLPLPQRIQFTPNFAQYEIAKDAARRAIQAAMGISPLPTAAQRNNEKSGVALQRIQAQQEVGSFHFVDGYERALQRLGRIVNSWIPVTYDTERELSLHKADDSRRPVRINTSEPYVDDQTQEPQYFPIGEEEHDVAISTGPSAASQRDAASDFLDLLISNLSNLPVGPEQRAKLLSLAIRMKQLGPIGDEMADLISPNEDGQQMPPQALQAVQGFQQQLQALNAYAQKLEAEKAELERKIESKAVEAESRERIERMKIEADLAKAEITTKAQNVNERLAFVEDMIRQLEVQAHEAGMQAAARAHETAIAAAQTPGEVPGQDPGQPDGQVQQ